MFSAVVNDTQSAVVQRELHSLLLTLVEVDPLKSFQGAQWRTAYACMRQIQLNDFIAGHTHLNW